jgi:hypothetical protein
MEILIFDFFFSKIIYYKIVSDYPNFENVKHLLFLQDTTPFEKYPEIIGNILNKQYSEFVERKKEMIYKICIFYTYFINMSST